MSFPDLRTFLEQLRRDNDVAFIDAPVDPVQEAAEIHRRVIAANGPALVFRNVTGADFPLVTNLFGTARRAELAFGERPLRLITRLVHLAETIMQVFSKDGKFVKEQFFEKDTLGSGSVWDIAFSKDAQQKYIFMADGMNQRINVIDRQSLQLLTSFGDGGRRP